MADRAAQKYERRISLARGCGLMRMFFGKPGTLNPHAGCQLTSMLQRRMFRVPTASII